MPHEQQSKASKPVGQKFWAYLFLVHATYALVLNFRIEWLRDARLTLAGFAYAEWSGLLDLVLLPALIYGYCARKNKMQAMFGALAMASLGLLAIRLWYPASALSASMSALLHQRERLMPVLWVMTTLLELFVLVKLLRHLRQPMKEGAIDLLLAPIARALGKDHFVLRCLAAEQRVWIYGLCTTLPKHADFAGQQHFSYAQQNGNASTWFGFFIANTIPIPILHLVLAAFAPTAAWVVTMLTALSSFWLWAEYRATQARPISLDAQTLFVRYGTLSDLEIAINTIQSARSLSWRDFDGARVRGEARPVLYQGMGAANVELRLQNGTIYRLGVDQPEIFLAELMARVAICSQQLEPESIP
jgi:hypothetical protein